MHKDLKKIAKALVDQDFEVDVTGRGHLLVAKNGRLVTVFSGSPSDRRSWKNSLAACRRAGFQWPPRR